MPLYEYQCEGCGEVFYELRRSEEREEPIACPDCGGEGKIIFSTFAQGAQPDSCSKRDRCSSGST
jgi:putative FmdB family regulatory protein